MILQNAIPDPRVGEAANDLVYPIARGDSKEGEEEIEPQITPLLPIPFIAKEDGETWRGVRLTLFHHKNEY